jgi:hypothetical protein
MDEVNLMLSLELIGLGENEVEQNETLVLLDPECKGICLAE